MSKQILPSIMAKSQKELNRDLKKLKGLVKELHLDVVDDKFASNEAMNFDFKLSSNFSYNIHLMVKEVKKWVDKVLKKKQIKIIIFHPEGLKKERIQNLIKKIKKQKRKVGLAIKPETKFGQIKEFLPDLDVVLILTVHPGFYGAKFLKSPLKKIRQVKKINPGLKIIVDGGMHPKTISLAKEADYFVSGSYTTKAENPKKAIVTLMKVLKRKKK